MESLKFNSLNYHYDNAVDALLLKINSMYVYDVSLEVNASTIIDVSKIGKVVAFEILDASKVLKLPVSSLIKEPSFNITVETTEDVIKVYMNYKIDDLMGSYIFKTLNDNNALTGVFKYYT